MSIACDWISACQLAIVDRLSGRATLVHVLETVASPRFPAQLPTFHVVATWHNPIDMVTTARLRVRIDEVAGEPGSVLSEEEVTFHGKTSHRAICIVQSLTVNRPGAYRVVASLQGPSGDWSDVAGHPFVVNTSGSAAGTVQA